MSLDRPSYWAALRHPHVARSFFPSLIGRLSLAMSGLAVVLVIEATTGSFAIAGAVTAVLGIANVVVTPWRARLIDQYGQLRILLPIGVLHAVALLAFTAAGAFPLSALILLGALAGVSSPPLGAGMRVIWAQAFAPGAQRNRGFSLDAVSEELVFTAGPLLAAVAAEWLDPTAALVGSALAVAVGSLSFVISPLSRREIGHRRSADTLSAARVVSPLRTRGFPVVVAAMLVPGVVLGAVEIAAPAIGVSENSTVLAGILLAVFAGASAIGGLIFGRLEVQASFARQILVLAAAMVILTSAVGLLGVLPALLIGFALMGGLLSPVMISGYLAADHLADPRARTEASSWINTAVNFGAAIGSGVMGLAADTTSPGEALALCGVIGAGILVACVPKLIRR